MSWEQHRYAVERAARMRREIAKAQDEQAQGVNLQGEANGSDAEMLEEVAEFLRSLGGSKAAERTEDHGQAFIADWNKMIATISVTARQWNMPVPQLICGPKWYAHMNSVATIRLMPVLVYAGVKIRFGDFEQADVLRTVQ